MNKKYLKLIEHIHNEDRRNAVTLALELLDSKEISIVELYEDVLTMALYDIDCQEGDKECIWKEHVQTSIVRTIVELVYPYVLKEKEETTLLKYLKSKPGKRILLDEHGKQFTSIKFSELISSHIQYHSTPLQFIIGGAYGFNESFLKEADLTSDERIIAKVLEMYYNDVDKTLTGLALKDELASKISTLTYALDEFIEDTYPKN